MRTHSTIRIAVLSVALLCGLGVLLSHSGLAGEDDGDTVFDNRSVQGRWGWSGRGSLVPPAVPEAVPTAGAGTVTFDGRGECSVATMVNVNGTFFGPATSDTCTYSVNVDGTGSSVATFSTLPFAGGPAVVSFVIVDRKKEIRFLQHGEFVVTFTAKRF